VEGLKSRGEGGVDFGVAKLTLRFQLAFDWRARLASSEFDACHGGALDALFEGRKKTRLIAYDVTREFSLFVVRYLISSACCA
jgi:hypothetical protein